jgi:hypothetical protein
MTTTPAQLATPPAQSEPPPSAVRKIWRMFFGKERRKQFLRMVGYRPINLSGNYVKWSRVVMEREVRKLIAGVHPEQLDCLEISGENFREFGFKSYSNIWYPEYDVCTGVLPGGRQFDLIIAEQIFEHLLWPYRAGRNVYAMLRPGGYFMISTPFMVKVHDYPVDCSRWTELGLKHFLAECGFPLEQVVTGSWGNRGCVIGNFNSEHVLPYRPGKDSLQNEPDVPYHVWALAKK